ncbi:DUF1858 domain-containing protein [Alkalibacter mobilis]|uniref:DUF1858 domain-containing protein n=1 Tax=Alkalibacter mobilis TaxID=2787712 RepID=UPI00189EF92A|nr:DUF1858 domain-containing protein [Alkalibacter mobilis]MBF7096176.1 DUF1858 domain-containing protein [Alkalibacter mobilis]
MNKILDMKMTVHELSKLYPEFPQIMRELGFDNIADPKMITTVGRFMTVEKGAAMKKIDLQKIKETFEKHGFKIKE